MGGLLGGNRADDSSINSAPLDGAFSKGTKSMQLGSAGIMRCLRHGGGGYISNYDQLGSRKLVWIACECSINY